jgi:hypothetical protein
MELLARKCGRTDQNDGTDKTVRPAAAFYCEEGERSDGQFRMTLIP